MAAATGEREALHSLGNWAEIEVAEGVKIWKGTMVALNADGFAVKGSDTAGLMFVGVAKGTVDNTDGLDGDLRVAIYRAGVVALKGAGFVAADLHKTVYIKTDQDVALASGVAEDILVGTIEGVIGGADVRVMLNPHASVDASDLADVEAAILELDTETGALGGENTDGVQWVGAHAFAGNPGSFTPGATGDLETLTRAGNANPEEISLSLDVLTRSAADKGQKLLSIDLVYSVDTAHMDDVLPEIVETTLAGDGSIPVAAVIAGNDAAHFDANHNTNVKRGDSTGGPKQHTLTLTPPAPAYLGAGSGLRLRVTIDGDAGASGSFVLYGALIRTAQTLVDLV